LQEKFTSGWEMKIDTNNNRIILFTEQCSIIHEVKELSNKFPADEFKIKIIDENHPNDLLRYSANNGKLESIGQEETYDFIIPPVELNKLNPEKYKEFKRRAKDYFIRLDKAYKQIDNSLFNQYSNYMSNSMVFSEKIENLVIVALKRDKNDLVVEIEVLSESEFKKNEVYKDL